MSQLISDRARNKKQEPESELQPLDSRAIAFSFTPQPQEAAKNDSQCAGQGLKAGVSLKNTKICLLGMIPLGLQSPFLQISVSPLKTLVDL